MIGHDPRTEGMSFLEKRSYRNLQLLGIPAGTEAYRQSMITASPHSGAIGKRVTALGRGTLAAGLEIGSPFGRGLMEMAGADMVYGKRGFSAHWMGFGFEKTGTMSQIARGQNPFTYQGNIFSDRGSKWCGVNKGGTRTSAGRAWSRGSPVAFAGLGLGFAAYAGVKGFHEGGVGGAAKAVAVESMWFAGFHLAGRLLGPAVIPMVAHATDYYQLVKGVKSRVAASPRHITYDIAGSLQAFSTQQAHTMRQRSLQSIQRHHLNARSALGNEASYMHVSSLRMM